MKMEIIRIFNVIKFVLDLNKQEVSYDYIKKALDDWALEAHNKKIIVDEKGFHHIDGTGYLSHPYWEDEIIV